MPVDVYIELYMDAFQRNDTYIYISNECVDFQFFLHIHIYICLYTNYLHNYL